MYGLQTLSAWSSDVQVQRDFLTWLPPGLLGLQDALHVPMLQQPWSSLPAGAAGGELIRPSHQNLMADRLHS